MGRNRDFPGSNICRATEPGGGGGDTRRVVHRPVGTLQNRWTAPGSRSSIGRRNSLAPPPPRSKRPIPGEQTLRMQLKRRNGNGGNGARRREGREGTEGRKS